MIDLPVSWHRFVRPFKIGIFVLVFLALLVLPGCVRPFPENDENSTVTNSPGTQAEPAGNTDQETNLAIDARESGYPLPPTVEAAVEPGGDAFILHTIEAGDTLSSIAAQYETSMAELMALNQIEDSDFIILGETLRVPGPDFESLSSPSFEIIPDSELVYGPAAKDFDLPTFTNQYDSFLSSYEEEVEGHKLTGPDIVQLVADRHSVNPKLLLAALEYESNWLTSSQPTNTDYPMGHVDEESAGLYKQLSWAANLFNWGFYGRAEGGMTSFLVNDEIPVTFDEETNLGTSGVQYYLASRDDTSYEDWLIDAGATGLYDTYSRLFGNPFDHEIKPLIPDDLAQPAFALPWTSGETWYYTGGPHGGWNSGSAWAALDFVPPNQEAGCSPSDNWATAVSDGVVSRSGFGAVVLDLDGDGYSGTGWAVTYMHLEDRDRTAVGTDVKTGDPLGHPGCEGGFTNGTHVHLARTYNGRWISADGELPFELGGWISYGEGFEYNGSLIKDGITKTADIYHTENNAITAN